MGNSLTQADLQSAIDWIILGGFALRLSHISGVHPYVPIYDLDIPAEVLISSGTFYITPALILNLDPVDSATIKAAGKELTHLKKFLQIYLLDEPFNAENETYRISIETQKDMPCLNIDSTDIVLVNKILRYTSLQGHDEKSYAQYKSMLVAQELHRSREAFE